MNHNLKMSVMIAVCCGATSVSADRLEALLPGLLIKHDTILAQEASVNAAERDVQKEWAAYLPTIDLTANGGWEKRNNQPGTANTETGRSREDIDISQTIWDFGRTSSSVKSADISLDRAKNDLHSEKQKLLLDAATAYLELMRTNDTLKYSKLSEDNFIKQTGMEEARVKRGSGLSTDVLQTKSSLAGATAKRVSAEGAFYKALNTYHAVFKYEPDVSTFSKPVSPFNLLPSDVAEAVRIALADNLDVKGSQYSIESAESDVKSSRANFLPEINFDFTTTHKRDDAGTFGHKYETTAIVEATYSLFAGGGDLADYRAKKKKLIESKYNKNQQKVDIEESVRNSWQDLDTSKANMLHLRNQANISGEFLDLARKERQLGTRSLLDVLNGETQYINALSAAAEAETQTYIDAYRLLADLGQLNLDVFLPDAQEMSENQ